MSVYLQVEDLTKSYGFRMLFAGVTFGVDEGNKIGVIAKNGTGKSTLLSIIAGTEAPDSGKITWRSGVRVGYLPQQPAFAGNPTVAEAALNGDDPIAEIVRRYETALAENNPKAIEEASHLMDSASAWDYEDRLRQLLSRLKITDLSARVNTLSGGQRKRVALASVLMSNPDMLILDEPTNHLDIEVIEWIENFLKRSRATLLMVTHDRYFLDRVCNRIIEIDNSQIYSYDGNYDYYLRRRAERIEAMTAELARVKNTLRREQEWMSRQPQARAGKAKYRIDNFYDLKARAAVDLRQRDVRLENQSSYIGSKIFEAVDVSKAFGPKIILDKFSYTFARYEKVGIIGPNGVGKSTFIKMLQGIEPIDSGRWDIGSTVRFGYYSQDGIQFNPDDKVIDAVTRLAEDIELKDGEHIAPMQYLQRFLFSVPDQQKYIHTLSGGERCRLHLATVLMRRPNFLILDEPTNDLDIITLGILEEYLAEFKGCAIIISHDRFFLDNIVDHIFVMEGYGIIRDFPGNYSEYRQWADELQRQQAADRPADRPASKEKPRQQRPEKLTYKEQREFEALTAEIDQLTAEKANLEAYFNAGGADDIAEKSRRYEQLKSILDEKELRWLELSEKA